MRSLLFATTLLAPFAAHAQLVVPPVVPPGGVAGINLVTNSPNPVPNGYRMWGQVFPQGAVQPTDILQLDNVAFGSMRPAQMTVRTKWPDGSVRLATMVGMFKGYKAGPNTAGFTLVTGGTSGAPIDIAAFTPGLATVTVQTATNTYVLDVGQMLAAQQTHDYWMQGPLATEARVDQTLEGAFHVSIDARVYADGTSQLDVTYANDLAFNAGGPESYTATVKLGTQTTTTTISKQQPFTTWHQVVQSAPLAGIIQVDVANLEATGMMPRYPLTGVQQSEIDGESPASPCDPLGACAVTVDMGQTGGRADIGLIPQWHRLALLAQTPQTLGYALQNADDAGSIPWHAEQAPGTSVNVSTYPNFWQDDRCSGGACSPMSFGAAWSGANHGLTIGGNKGIVPDIAHPPEVAYTAYLLTGGRYYLDELNAEVGYAEGAAWPQGVRNWTGTAGVTATGGLVLGVNEQLRGGAWGLRELFLASIANPDGSAQQSYAQGLLATNLAWIGQDAALSSKGQLVGWLDASYGGSDNGVWAPWQNDFVALTLQWATQAGTPGASTALSAMTPFLVNRFDQTGSFCAYNAGAYNLRMGPTDESHYTTWNQVQSATVAWGTDNCANPPNQWAYDYGTAATSVVRVLPSSPAQQQALAWVNAHPAASGSAPDNPAWVLTP